MPTKVITQNLAQEIMALVEPVIAPNSLAVMKKRYLRQNAKGEVMETPAEMFYRVAAFMASIDAKWDQAADVKSTTRLFYTMLAK